MKLENGTMRPGTIVKVIDNQGTIKVEAPGLFSIADDPDLLPNVYPLFLFGTNSYSTPLKGDEVWVLNFSDNEQQLYWFRKDNLDDDKSLLTDQEGKIDILLHRDSYKGWGTLYFSDGSGWVISRDSSKINIDKDGNIHLSHPNPNRTISIGTSGISLGKKDKSDHTACFADQLIPILNSMTLQWSLLKEALKSSPYTIAAAECIDVERWKNDINNIESTNVTLQ